jgi:O-antigen/teichoic acid export membrane protein
VKQNPGKQKLVKDISANTLQIGINQVFGLALFYLTSKYLTKGDFGEFNWAMAVGSTVIALASLGLDLVFVKRVASGQNILVISGIHFSHTVITGVFVCIVAFIAQLLYPSFSVAHPFFFLILVNLTLTNIGNSFKLCLNGLEAYRQMAVLAFCSNVVKLLAVLFVVLVNKSFTILNVVTVYLIVSALELILGYWMVSREVSAPVKPVLNLQEYKLFILESLPQLGVVLFDSALARIDWILLGILSTTIATAEYSFVYKIFELSKFPLLIVSPILLTRFSKLFSVADEIDNRNRHEIMTFFKLELFIVSLIPVVLISVWSPLMDYFTDNKYGQVNEISYWILAPCVPFVCIINFLWTLGFVQGQLKAIMFITMAVSLINIAANIILIPFYGQMGASIAFLASTLIQLILYLLTIKQEKIKLDTMNSFIAIFNATLAICLARLSSNNTIFTCLIAVVVHVGLAFLTRQVSVKELRKLLRP